MTEPKTLITPVHYVALQRPVVSLPTPEQLFDHMVETLVAKELAKYEHADPFREKLPTGLFLLIPPRPAELDLGHLLGLIEFEGKKGTNNLTTGDLTDKVTVPEGPYLMAGIEDGRSRLNTKPSVSEANITAENRSPYVTFEGIIHGVLFHDVFRSHNMDLCGSRYESKHVPHLHLDDDRPKLSADWYDSANPKWGTPSCGSRIGA